MLRQKIEKIIQSYATIDDNIMPDILDEIMNEISKEVYGKPLAGME